MFKIIDNKKVDLTEDEYKEYVKICRSYDRQFFKGEELFKDLFETNEDGFIVYIKGLGNRQFSFEVVFFLMNLMQNQWLRASMRNVHEMIISYSKKFDDKLAQLDAEIAKRQSQ